MGKKNIGDFKIKFDTIEESYRFQRFLFIKGFYWYSQEFNTNKVPLNFIYLFVNVSDKLLSFTENKDYFFNHKWKQLTFSQAIRFFDDSLKLKIRKLKRLLHK